VVQGGNILEESPIFSGAQRARARSMPKKDEHRASHQPERGPKPATAGSLAPWLLGSLAPWLLGSLAPWLLGSSAPWLLGSSALRLLGSLASTPRWLAPLNRTRGVQAHADDLLAEILALQ
jgi:hypothetical protein